MTWKTLSLAIPLLLLSAPADAWLFQPKQNETVSNETVAGFSDASQQTLRALSDLLGAFADAEASEKAISAYRLDEISVRLSMASEQFKSLILNERQLLSEEIEPSELDAIDEAAANYLRRTGAQFRNLLELASFASEKSFSISNLVRQLASSPLSPSNASDSAGRAAINAITQEAYQFIITLNTYSGALALEIQ